MVQEDNIKLKLVSVLAIKIIFQFIPGYVWQRQKQKFLHFDHRKAELLD